MARYIDADVVRKFVDERVTEGKDGWAKGVPYEWAFALTVIDNAPTADVVPKVMISEIFRDIGILFNKYPTLGTIGGKELAELKKKYTEGEDNGKH